MDDDAQSRWIIAAGAVLVAVLVALGLAFFLIAEQQKWVDLGVGLLTGAVVGLSALVLSIGFEHRSNQLAAAAERERLEAKIAAQDERRQAEERHRQEVIRLTLTLQNNLAGTDLADLDLTGYYLAQRSFVRARLERSQLDGAVLNGSDMTEASGKGVSLVNAEARETTWVRSELAGAQMTQADLVGAVLSDADLTGADLSHADLHGADLAGAELRDADLTGADLTSANLTGAKLRGARLTGATLAGTVLIGIKSSPNTAWPEGFNLSADD